MDIAATMSWDVWLVCAVILWIVYERSGQAIDAFGHWVDCKYPTPAKPLAFEEDGISVAHQELIESAREVLDCFEFGPRHSDPLGIHPLFKASEDRLAGCLEALNRAIT